MKKASTIIILFVLMCSVLLNIVMLLKTNNKKSVIGIYQAQYYNNYKMSMTITLKIKKNGVCKFSDYATEYSNLETDCTWEKNKDTIVVKISDKKSYNVDILSDGNLLFNNHKLEKIG